MTALWLQEPATHSFEYQGRKCYMARNNSGAWCGYVRIPADSPLFGKNYDLEVQMATEEQTHIAEIGVMNVFFAALGSDDKAPDLHPLTLLIRCHGGLTYANAPWWDESEAGNAQWWLGFDCAHAGDLSPQGGYRSDGATYRTLEYVSLCLQQMVEDIQRVERNAGFPTVSYIIHNFGTEQSQ